MEPLIALVAVTLGARLAGYFGVGHFKCFGAALRAGVAAMFVLTGTAHFNHMRADLVRMVPPFVGHPEFWVTFTGVAELCGAIGILVPRTRRMAAAGLSLLLLAVFPANVVAAVHGVTFAGDPPEPLALRALEQVVFLAAVLAAGFGGARAFRGIFAARKSGASSLA